MLTSDEGTTAVLDPVLVSALELYFSMPSSSSSELLSVPNCNPDAPFSVVALSGFSWSGSGAVADFLRGRNGVAFPFGDTEVSLFEGYGNWSTGANKVLELATNGTPTEARQAAAIFLLSAVFPLIPAGNSPKTENADRWIRKSIFGVLRAKNMKFESIAPECMLFLSRIRASITSTKIECALSSFLNSLLAHLSPGEKILVLNNAIHGKNIGLLRLLANGDGNAIGIVVHRDPRDQYVARCLEDRRRAKMSPEAFVVSLKEEYQQYAVQRQDPLLNGKVLDIGFANFLNSDETRARILSRIGIEDNGTTGTLRLEVSRVNIGIHRSFSTPADLELISETDFGNSYPV
jgi:hypothetical protein